MLQCDDTAAAAHGYAHADLLLYFTLNTFESAHFLFGHAIQRCGRKVLDIQRRSKLSVPIVVVVIGLL